MSPARVKTHSTPKPCLVCKSPSSSGWDLCARHTHQFSKFLKKNEFHPVSMVNSWAAGFRAGMRQALLTLDGDPTRSKGVS